MYYVKLYNKPFGPFNEQKISQMLATGRVTTGTEISTDKRSWKPLYQFPELTANIAGQDQQTQQPVSQQPQYDNSSQMQESYDSQPAQGNSFWNAVLGLFQRKSSQSNNAYQDVPPIPQQNYSQSYQDTSNQSRISATGIIYFLIGLLFCIVIFQSVQLYRISSNANISASSSDSNIKRLAKEAPKSVVKIVVSLENGIATGSGVVIAHDDKSALILTNRHVISEEIEDPKDSKKTTITICKKVGVAILDAKDGQVNSGAIKDATVVATPSNENVDLALVFVGDPDNKLLPQWKIASMANLEQGDSVYAIGHPGDFPFTITAGICSAKRNRATHWEVQHTASINHGNSGGPLLNNKGEIIGINTYMKLKSDDDAFPDTLFAELKKGDPFAFYLYINWRLDSYNNLFFAMPADFIFDDSQWEFHAKEEQTKLLLEKVPRVSKKGK